MYVGAVRDEVNTLTVLCMANPRGSITNTGKVIANTMLLIPNVPPCNTDINQRLTRNLTRLLLILQNVFCILLHLTA